MSMNIDNSELSELQMENIEAMTYELPEVQVVCDSGVGGRCHRQDIKNSKRIDQGNSSWYVIPCMYTGMYNERCTPYKYQIH